MFKVNEADFEYRFGDSGPKYLMKGPRANFGVVRFKPGEDFQNHLHNVMEENFFILEGQLVFEVGGEKMAAKKGDFIHVEPGETHYLRNESGEPALAVFCLAPFKDNDKVEVEQKIEK